MSIFKERRIVSFISLTKQAFGRYRWHILTLTILGFVSGLLEGVGVNALIPLFSFLQDGPQGSDDIVSRTIVNFFAFLNIELSILWLLLFIVFLFICKGFIMVWLNYIRAKIVSHYEEETRNRLFRSILFSDWQNVIKQKSGYLETVLMIDVPAGSALLGEISSFIMTTTGLLIYLLIAVNINSMITLVTLIFGTVLFLFYKPLFYRIKTIANKRVEVNKEATHHIGGSLTGMKTIKTMGVQEAVLQRGAQFFATLKQLLIQASLIKGWVSSFIQPLGVVLVVGVFAFSYWLGDFNLAALAAIIYLIQKIFVYIQQEQGSLQNMNNLLPHLRSVVQYETNATYQPEQNRGRKPFVFTQQLELVDMSFAYQGQSNVLSDINFVIRKGETVGLVGPSGVGKTTLVDIILRLLPPSRGRLLLDRQDAQEIDLDEWRNCISYVPQDMFLMNDTIENNIAFYDSKLTRREIEQYAEMAAIAETVNTLPRGYETVVGNQGVLLSVGQRQRIAIARALARKPKVLILDEATSALDTESEMKIQQVVEKLKSKLTIIIIAHRLSTVMDCDKIVVLENGQIQEIGSPAELLKDEKSYFFKVYHMRE